MEDLYLDLKAEQNNKNILGEIINESGIIKWIYDASLEIIDEHNIEEHLKNIMEDDFEIINEILVDYENIVVSSPYLEDEMISVYFSN